MKKKVIKIAIITLLGAGISGAAWATTNYNHVFASPIAAEKTAVDLSDPNWTVKSSCRKIDA